MDENNVNQVKKKKCVYETTDEIWGKVLQVRTTEGLESVHDSLDYLVKIGYESWKNGKSKENK